MQLNKSKYRQTNLILCIFVSLLLFTSFLTFFASSGFALQTGTVTQQISFFASSQEGIFSNQASLLSHFEYVGNETENAEFIKTGGNAIPLLVGSIGTHLTYDLKREKIHFGQPVEWKLTVVNVSDFTESTKIVKYHTAPLTFRGERMQMGDVTIDRAILSTKFTNGYDNISFTYALNTLLTSQQQQPLFFIRQTNGTIFQLTNYSITSGLFELSETKLKVNEVIVNGMYEVFAVYSPNTIDEEAFMQSMMMGVELSEVANYYLSDNFDENSFESYDAILGEINSQEHVGEHHNFVSTSQKNFFAPDHGEFIFESSEGNISYIFLDSEQQVVVSISNISSKELYLRVNLPFLLDKDITYYLWNKRLDGTVEPLNYQLDETQTKLILNLEDGGHYDEDTTRNGELVLSFLLPTSHPNLRVEKQLKKQKGRLVVNDSVVGVQTSSGTLSSLQYVQLESTATKKYSRNRMPYELTRFEISDLTFGETVSVFVSYPEVSQNDRLAKYNSITDEWYMIPFERIDDTTVRIDLTDGGFGDDDGVVNGKILDDIGLIIIPITQAFHLDGTGSVISDITDKVITQDEIWSNVVFNGERVNVVFEENLTSINDVTIYAQGLSSEFDTINVAVFEHYTQNYMGTFYDITSEAMDKIYLTNLQGQSDKFDLVVISSTNNSESGVSFDLIIDPTAIPTAGDTMLAPQACVSENQAAADSFGGVCGGTYPAACGAGNDLLSCDDGLVESFQAKKDLYGGVRIETFNSTYTACDSIDAVSVCYEWWADKGNLNNCDISFDNDGDGTWTSVSPGCPGTTANPGVTCTDVTGLDNDWTCDDFFGTGPITYARLKAEAAKSTNAGGIALISWDALYFNVSFTADTTDPTVTLTTPTTASSTNATTVNFVYTPTDANLASCTLYGDFNGTWAANETNSSLFSGVSSMFSITLAQGLYIWNVMCIDDAPNTAFATSNFTLVVDTAAPTITQNSPTSNVFTTDTTPTFDWTATDVYDSSLSCDLYIDDILEQSSIASTSGVAKTYTSSALTVGIHNWSVSCIDNAQNRFTSATLNFTIDTTAPTILIDYPSDLSVFGTGPVEFNWTMTDALSPNATCDLYADAVLNKSMISLNNTQSSQTITGFSGGDHTWYVRCTDLATNVQTSATRTITIDTVPPAVDLISPIDNVIVNATPILFEYNVTDAATTIASCSLILNGTSVSTDNTITETITQSFSFTPVENLNHNWTVSCTDIFSNVGTGSPVRDLGVDKTLPVITTEEANGTSFAVNDYICLNETVTDSASGVSTVTAYVNTPSSGVVPITLTTGASCGNAGGSVYAAEVLLDELGTYTWTHSIAVDVAGNIRNELVSPVTNWTTSSSYLLASVIIAPVVAFEINESDATIYDFRQECSVTCDVSSVGTCEDVMITAQHYVSFWNPTNTTVQDFKTSVDSYSCGNLTPSSSCAYNFTVETSTTSGNQVLPIRCGGTSSNAPSDFSSNISVTINDHPVADFSIPITNNTVLNATVTLNSNGTDDQGIATYTFEIDSFNTFASSTTICSGASNTCALDTDLQTQCADNSVCYIRQTVNDTDGLIDILDYQIEIDNTAPTVSLEAPTNNTLSGTAVTLSYTPTDPYLNSCTLYGNFSGVWISNETNSSPTTTVQDDISLTLPTGIYIWNVQCVDDYTNTGFATQNYTLRIDASKPTVILNTPTSASLLTTSSFNFTYTPADSNLDVCWLYTDKGNSWGIDDTNNSPISGVSNTFSENFADGDYIWNVYCADTLNNEDYAPINFSVTIDTTDPTAFSLVSPTNNTQSNDRTPLLDWENTVDLTFMNYTLELDTAPDFATPDFTHVLTNTVTNSSFQIVSNLVDNTKYFWRVTAYDNASHETASSQNFTYITDNVNPVVSLEAPADSIVYTANAALEFDFNVSDTNDILNCSVLLNGAIDTSDSIYNVLKDQTVTIYDAIGNGDYNWSVLCYDYAGNSHQTTNRSLTINISYPQYTFYATASFNTQSPAISYSVDGSPNSYGATCVKNAATTVTTATGSVGGNGFIIAEDQVVSYSSNISVGRAMYATWKSYYNNGGGFTLITQDGDDGIGGTAVSSGQTAVSSSSTLTPSGDVVLDGSGNIRFLTNLFYNSGSGTTACTEFYDVVDTSIGLYGIKLGFLNATNYNESVINMSILDTLKVTCEYDCTQGFCMNAKGSLETNSSGSWVSIGPATSDVLSLKVGEQNDVSLGNINSTQNLSFVIQANRAGLDNYLRCSASSTYDTFNGTQYLIIDVLDIEPPVINMHNATPNLVDKNENITFYANVTDNVAVDTVLVTIDGINYTMLNSSPDLYQYTINTSIVTGGTQNYTIYANDTSNNFAIIGTDFFTVRTLDLFVQSVTFETDIVEGANTVVQVNISNAETVAALNIVLNVSISLYSGSYIWNETITELINVSAQSNYTANLTWNAKVGTAQFFIDVDSTDVEEELDETNNNYTVYVDVYSWEIIYGNILNAYTVLIDSSDNGFTNWSLVPSEGISYYADVDASWLPFNLIAFNESNDFNQSDIDLGMTYYNDSIQKLFDLDDDGIADQTRVFKISGSNVTVPITNSTNSTSFITGILYDGADGTPYDGTQDLVFVTVVNVSEVGKYGTYDYEVRIPSPLAKQVAGTDVVLRLDELD